MTEMIQPMPIPEHAIAEVRARWDTLPPEAQAAAGGVHVPGAVVGYGDLLESHEMLRAENERLRERLRKAGLLLDAEAK